MAVSVSWHDVAYPIDLRWRQLERLWISGTLFDGPATDAQVLAELQGIAADIQLAIKRFEIKTGDWLD